jgi:hypothetical protein
MKWKTRLREGNRVVYVTHLTGRSTLGRDDSPTDGPREASDRVGELACVQIGC